MNLIRQQRMKKVSKEDEQKAVDLINDINAICGELGKYMNKHTPKIKKARKGLHHTLINLELYSLFIIPNKKEIENRKLISRVALKIKSKTL